MNKIQDLLRSWYSYEVLHVQFVTSLKECLNFAYSVCVIYISAQIKGGEVP